MNVEDLIDVALAAHGRASYRWSQKPRDDRDEPCGVFAMRAAVAAIIEKTELGRGCPCEPSGSDGLTCPRPDGSLLCQDKPCSPVANVLAWLVMYGDRVVGYTDAENKSLVRLAEGESLVAVVEAGQLSEIDKDVAVAQAVEFAQYVESHAKGTMVEAAKRFLSLPYAQQIAARLQAVAP